jgi:tetratricopeptide (TPR) repeat protein
LPAYFADKNDLAEARELFEKLVARAPDYAGGYAGLSRAHSLAVMRGYTRTPDQNAATALTLAEKAHELDPEGEFTRLALADAKLAAGRLEEAIAILEALVQDAPSSADAHGRLGLMLIWVGRTDEAFGHIDAAIRLNPYVGSPYLNYLGLAEFTIGRYDAAVAAFERNSARGGPIDDAGLAALTASYNELGRSEYAQASLAQLIERYPGVHLRGLWLLHNFARAEDRARLTETLRRAEIPMDRPYTR